MHQSKQGANLLVNKNTMSVTMDRHSLISFVFRTSAMVNQLVGGA
jgi:hypothetical protein